jgi:hypothetical protein
MNMTNETRRLLAVSALIGECESLTASGDLNESQERALRLCVAHVRAAYEMPIVGALPRLVRSLL